MTMVLPEDVKQLLNNCECQFYPTGSAYICNPPVEDTDEDWVVLSKPSAILYLRLLDNLLKLGFVTNDVYGNLTRFKSLRRGNINLILTINAFFYNAFITATEVCKEQNILRKEDRIKIFTEILQEDNLEQTYS